MRRESVENLRIEIVPKKILRDKVQKGGKDGDNHTGDD